jgi:hypothetical protein
MRLGNWKCLHKKLVILIPYCFLRKLWKIRPSWEITPVQRSLWWLDSISEWYSLPVSGVPSMPLSNFFFSHLEVCLGFKTRYHAASQMHDFPAIENPKTNIVYSWHATQIATPRLCKDRWRVHQKIPIYAPTIQKPTQWLGNLVTENKWMHFFPLVGFILSRETSLAQCKDMLHLRQNMVLLW